jgi:hypothetical protein
MAANRTIAFTAQDLLPTQLYTSFSITSITTGYNVGSVLYLGALPNVRIVLTGVVNVGDTVINCQDFSPPALLSSGAIVHDNSIPESGALANTPSNPTVGQMYFDSVNNVPLWWNGSAWQNIGWFNTGAPSNSFGANGDFYFRADGTHSGTSNCIYHKENGVWFAIA